MSRLLRCGARSSTSLLQLSHHSANSELIPKHPTSMSIYGRAQRIVRRRLSRRLFDWRKDASLEWNPVVPEAGNELEAIWRAPVSPTNSGAWMSSRSTSFRTESPTHKLVIICFEAQFWAFHRFSIVGLEEFDLPPNSNSPILLFVVCS